MARRLARAGERVERLVVIRASARGARRRRYDAAARALTTALRRPGAEVDLWRERLAHLAEAWSAASGAERLRLLGAKLRRLPRAFAAPPAPGAASRAEEPDAAPGSLRRERLRDVYVRAAALYAPGPYAGRVTLFWPERDEEAPSEAARWWRQVAAEVELEVLPGDHLSYATRHVEAFARALDACLGASPAAPRAGTGEAAC
jgi:thioesterase domain-containing protein